MLGPRDPKQDKSCGGAGPFGGGQPDARHATVIRDGGNRREGAELSRAKKAYQSPAKRSLRFEIVKVQEILGWVRGWADKGP